MKTIVVIPTYNERENISRLIQKIAVLGIENLSVLVVDDNSPDGTGDIVLSLAQKYPVELLARPGKQGIGSAYIAGFQHVLSSHPDYIIQMDADLSHDPDDIPRMLEAIQDADLVIGSRRVPGGQVVGWGIVRKLMSAGAMWCARAVLGLKTKDVTAGFRCFRASVLEAIPFDQVHSGGYSFQEEMLFLTEQRGFRVREIPVTFVDRQQGKSKLGWGDIFEFFQVLLRLKRGKRM